MTGDFGDKVDDTAFVKKMEARDNPSGSLGVRAPSLIVVDAEQFQKLPFRSCSAPAMSCVWW